MTSADDFVVNPDDGDPRIKAGKLVGTVAGSIVLAVFSGYIRLIETITAIHVRIINGISGFLEAMVTAAVSDSAGVVVSSWGEAAESAVTSGEIFAPWLLVIDALVVLVIVTTLWDRRPYA